MKQLLAIGCLLICAQVAQARVGCKAYFTSTESRIEVYSLERCEDVKFKGGGVVIKYIIDPTHPTLGHKSATVYYPAHRVRSVTVQESDE